MVHRLEDVTFTITVRNVGEVAVQHVVVTDRISDLLEFIRISTTRGSAWWDNATRTLTAEIGVMNPGEVVSITITARVVNIPEADLPETIYDTAVVDFAGAPDPVTSNQTETVVVYFMPGEIPEPSTVFMLGSGLLGLAGYAQAHRRRRRREEEAASLEEM